MPSITVPAANVVEYGVIKLSHLINRGAQDITQAMSKALGLSMVRAEELKRQYGLGGGKSVNPTFKKASILVLDYIFGEANRALLNYQKRYNKNIERMVLTGGGAVLKELLPLATERLEIDVELADPFLKIETPAFLEDVLKEVGPEFTGN